MTSLLKIVSGGQTGADRAGLDWAISMGIPHGGWCPRGRKAEDGVIPARYQLTETKSADYLTRTRWNVRDSNATVIFTLKPTLSGGSLRTAGLPISSSIRRNPSIARPDHAPLSCRYPEKACSTMRSPPRPDSSRLSPQIRFPSLTRMT